MQIIEKKKKKKKVGKKSYITVKTYCIVFELFVS